MTINRYVIQLVLAPMRRPCFEQIACGMISPKMTMNRVDKTIAMPPVTNSSMRTVVVELIITLARRIVHRR